ncbi:hypothetical protein GEOBRER4_n2826 [Citrifermentans bremense]|uniref:Uncharacterized protein n=1 Tax=Citrifermentans bremense TaxID=60035 RepID=A0A6S6M2R4_9BACT|nr:hypothetical protein [Citrifermentans bremense]BCG47968.1 hypothetical protein GEOBRER4_n2826 [Citrifermentans bremense]
MPASTSPILSRTIAEFCLKMQEARTYGDAVASIRIVGEFSAGKTMLVRTLLEGLAEPGLLPHSAMERETFLPLEVTYGPRVRLTVLERPTDDSPSREIAELCAFPNRQEQLTRFQRGTHRLRLEVPGLESRVILPPGEDYLDSEEPLRFSLVDMPGWNSGESRMEENPQEDLMGEWNLAAVYVANACRLDSALNQELLERFCDASFSSFPAVLYYLITSCPSVDRERIVAREQKRARELLTRVLSSKNMDEGDFVLVVEAVDFEAMSSAEKELFRENFWCGINRPPRRDGNIWERLICEWPPEWEVNGYFSEVGTAVERARATLIKVKRDGRYLARLNRTMLLELSPEERAKKVMKTWLEQLGVADAVPAFFPATRPLPSGHPLSAWWSNYFEPSLREIRTPLETLLEEAARAISLIPEEADIESYLSGCLDGFLVRAEEALYSSFASLCSNLTALSKHSPTEIIATALTLSVMDGKYRDYLSQTSLPKQTGF